MHVNRASHVSGIVFRNTRFGNITRNTWQDNKDYPAIEMGMNYGQYDNSVWRRKCVCNFGAVVWYHGGKPHGLHTPECRGKETPCGYFS